MFYQTTLMLKSQAVTHIRERYRIMDILGDLGGVIEIIMIVLGTVLYPISEHSFILKAV